MKNLRSMLHRSALGAITATALLTTACTAPTPPAPPSGAPPVTSAPQPPPSAAPSTSAGAQRPSPSASGPPQATITRSSPAAASSSPQVSVAAGKGADFRLAASDDGSFRVEMPGPTTEEVQVLSGGEHMRHLHTDKRGAVVYDVSWAELDPKMAAFPPSMLVEKIAESMSQSDPTAQVEARQLQSAPDVAAMMVTLEDKQRGASRSVMAVAGGRTYQLTVTARPGVVIDPKEAARFFDSFTLPRAPRPVSTGNEPPARP